MCRWGNMCAWLCTTTSVSVYQLYDIPSHVLDVGEVDVAARHAMVGDGMVMRGKKRVCFWVAAENTVFGECIV